MHSLRCLRTTALLGLAAWHACLAGMFVAAAGADLLLVGGTIVDGTGNPGYVGSVAIADGKIVAVGEIDNEIGNHAKLIACQGKIVCPGFIDLHNHSDRSLLLDSTKHAECYLTQGCTTLVTGNCGSGPIDAANYYAKLSAGGVGINVAHLLPQGDLREAVIGNVRRGPTADEIEKMKELAAQAMQGGAWGMSTGLQYVPGSYADTAELVAVASVVAQHGGIYASHMRDESDQLLEAVEETIEIGKRAHLPVHISHFKSSKRHNWGKIRLAAELVQRASSRVSR